LASAAALAPMSLISFMLLMASDIWKMGIEYATTASIGEPPLSPSK